jgi:hypothetical protein
LGAPLKYATPSTGYIDFIASSFARLILTVRFLSGYLSFEICLLQQLSRSLPIWIDRQNAALESLPADLNFNPVERNECQQYKFNGLLWHGNWMGL